MNRVIKTGLALGLISLSATSAYATDLAGNSTAKISSVITIAEDTAMGFGTVLKDATGATLTLATAGSISGQPGGYTLSGSPASAQFTANGDASALIDITFSTGDTLVSGANSMALNNFTHDAGGTPAFTGGGTLTFRVGADLTVGATQVSGDYAGTYTVTVNYQ